MKCPDCNTNVELTWSRYFKSPFSRFVCPECKAKFKLARTWQYYIWSTTWVVATIIGGFYLLTRDNQVNVAASGAFYLLMVCIYLPVDKAIESKLNTKRR
jgi:hypothetical protein